MDEKQRATKQEQIVHNGQPAWVYSDGSIRNDSGHFLTRHPDGAPLITSANARELRHKRQLLHAQAAMDGIIQAAKDGRSLDYVPGSQEAWALMVEQIAQIPYKTNAKDRDRIDALRALAVVADLLPGRQGADDSGRPAVDGDVLELVLERASLRVSRS